MINTNNTKEEDMKSTEQRPIETEKRGEEMTSRILKDFETPRASKSQKHVERKKMIGKSKEKKKRQEKEDMSHG